MAVFPLPKSPGNHFKNLSCDLEMDQGHQNWYGSVKLNGGYHLAKFQRSLFISLWKKANIKVFLVIFGYTRKAGNASFILLKFLTNSWKAILSMDTNVCKNHSKFELENTAVNFTFSTSLWSWILVKVTKNQYKIVKLDGACHHAKCETFC